MIQCLIIDDNPMARLAIRSFVEEVDFLTLAKECENAIQAINFLQTQQIDLLFLDVEMPQMTGLEMLESLTDKPLVILVTSKSDYAVDAFNLDVIDYIVKPIKLARFLKAVNKAKDFLQTDRKEENTFIFARIDNILTRVDLDQILYIEAMGDYIRIATSKKKHTVHATLKSIWEKLPAERFIRIHRSHIVALDKIDSFADNMVTIEKAILPVSEGYRGLLLEKLNGF